MSVVARDEGVGSIAKREPTGVVSEDGRLLRMFVVRGVHRNPDARERATKDWLIRESFYDDFLEDYIACYGSDEDLAVLDSQSARERLQEIQESCQVVLKAKPVVVSDLEKTVQAAAGDVHKLRDALLAAVKDLTTPRRRLGLMTGATMTEEDIMKLKEARQARLRDVVFSCLQGIWMSGVGGEVLQVAMQQVHNLINKFESREDDIRDAIAGQSWHKLKALVNEIEGDLPETARKKHIEIEGKGTKLLVQKALEALGGRASTQEIISWVEANPDAVDQCNIKINKRESARSEEVWRGTLRCALSTNFKKSARKRADGLYVWMNKDEEDDTLPPLALTQSGDSAAASEGLAIVASGDAADGSPAASPQAEGEEAASPAPAAEEQGAGPGKRRRAKAQPKRQGGAKRPKVSDVAIGGAGAVAGGAVAAPVAGAASTTPASASAAASAALSHVAAPVPAAAASVPRSVNIPALASAATPVVEASAGVQVISAKDLGLELAKAMMSA